MSKINQDKKVEVPDLISKKKTPSRIDEEED